MPLLSEPPCIIQLVSQLYIMHYSGAIFRPSWGSKPPMAVVLVAADLAGATNPAIDIRVAPFCPRGKQEK